MTKAFLSERFPGLLLIAANLKNALRALCFLRPLEIEPGWLQLIQLTLLNVLLHFILDFAQIGLSGEISFYGLPAVLFFLPVLIFLTRLFVRTIGRREEMFSLLILLSAMWLPISVLCTLCKEAGGLIALPDFLWPVREYGGEVFRLWFVLAAARAALRICMDGKRWKLGLLALTILLIACIPYAEYVRQGTLWSKPYNPEEFANWNAKQHPFDSENALYAQGRLLDQTLGAIRPGRPDRINLFFVGLAGYAGQDVFMKEIHSIDALFRERFGTAGHSAVLINNPASLEQTPIANTTSLQLVLNQVGAVMERNRDILFLYMTSHGSRDHKFSLQFGDMRFNDLDPPRLRKILDQSGIKRRVIVIAACYSGGFIDALKDDNTLVVTAAAADKTSFGCSNEEDFTYFGRAYFNEALRKTDSFIDAYNMALPVIVTREKAVKAEPSNPQIYVGAGIKAVLAQWQAQRKDGVANP